MLTFEVASSVSDTDPPGPVAVRERTHDLTSVPSETVDTCVQPDGVVNVAARFVVTNSTSRSPDCAPPGRATEVLTALVIEAVAPWKVIDGGGGGLSVTVTCVLVLPVRESLSVTVRETV